MTFSVVPRLDLGEHLAAAHESGIGVGAADIDSYSVSGSRFRHHRRHPTVNCFTEVSEPNGCNAAPGSLSV